MMKKRLFSLCSLLLLIFVIGSMFVGCSNKSNEPPPQDSLRDHPLIGAYCDRSPHNSEVSRYYYHYLVIEYDVAIRKLWYWLYYVCQEKSNDPIFYRDKGDFRLRKLYIENGKITENETDTVYCNEDGFREEGEITFLSDKITTDPDIIEFRTESSGTYRYLFNTKTKSIAFTNWRQTYFNTDQSFEEIIEQLNEDRYHDGDPLI